MPEIEAVADIWDKSTRSRVMARIKGKNTKPEWVVRRFLFANGFRFRLHVNTLPGHPDIVLPAYKTIVLVHGCFWHLHPGCKTAHIPASNSDFWKQKLHRNAERDAIQLQQLRDLGWRVILIWECELGAKQRKARLANLLREITDESIDFKANPGQQENELPV